MKKLNSLVIPAMPAKEWCVRNVLDYWRRKCDVFPADLGVCYFFCPDCMDAVREMPKMRNDVTALQAALAETEHTARSRPDQDKTEINNIKQQLIDLKHIVSGLKQTQEMTIKDASSQVLDGKVKNDTKQDDLQSFLGHLIKEELKGTMDCFAREIHGQTKHIVESIERSNAHLARSFNNMPSSSVGHQPVIVQSSVPTKPKTDKPVPGVKEPMLTAKQISKTVLEVETRNKLNEIIHLDDTAHDKAPMTQLQQSSSANNPKMMVVGTNTGSLKVMAAEERIWYYVGNLSENTSSENLESYLKTNGISAINCEKMVGRNAHVGTFKIAIKPGDKDKILNSDIWPSTVVVKPFNFNFNRNRPQERFYAQRTNTTNFHRKGPWRKPY